jgi:SAM-dependent methyltransferase
MTIFFFLFFAIVVTFAYAGWRAAPWVPMKKDDTERLLALAALRQGDVLYDLGCGDGRVVCAAGRVGATARGFEISLLPFLLAHIRRMRENNRRRMRISFRDFWHADLRDANVVSFFLMPKVYAKLRAKLEQELKPGTKVIAYVWPIDGWTPVTVDTAPGHPKLFLYRIGEHRPPSLY